MRKIRRFPTPGTIKSRMSIESSMTFLMATIASPHPAQVRRKFGESQGRRESRGKVSAFGPRDDAAAENDIRAVRVEKHGRLSRRGCADGLLEIQPPAGAFVEREPGSLLGMARADAGEHPSRRPRAPRDAHT